MKKILSIILLFSVSACTSKEPSAPITLSSPAFAEGATIPVDYSCDGNDTNPALTWTDPPSGTESFALIMDDPDAYGWVHWIIFNIPASTRDLKAATPTDAQLSDGSLQGRSSAYTNGYHGPCPPSGVHHYSFKLYALDTMLDLDETANRTALVDAMEGHILAEAQLTGTFSR